MNRIAATALVFLSLAFPAMASDQAAAVIDQARADCAAFENGTLSVPEGAIVTTDLSGDGQPDTLIDTSKISCSSAASLYCGTGGCSVFVIIGDAVTNLLVKGWQIVDWEGDRILVTAVHGYECGGTNLRHCYRAYVWNEGALRTPE